MRKVLGKLCLRLIARLAIKTMAVAPWVLHLHSQGRTGLFWARIPSTCPTVLLKGLAGRIEVNGQNFSGNMPSFAAQWDDTNLAAIAQYVRGLQGNTTVSNTPQEWADLRQSTGSPPQTRLMRLGLLGAK